MRTGYGVDRDRRPPPPPARAGRRSRPATRLSLPERLRHIHAGRRRPHRAAAPRRPRRRGRLPRRQHPHAPSCSATCAASCSWRAPRPASPSTRTRRPRSSRRSPATAAPRSARSPSWSRRLLGLAADGRAGRRHRRPGRRPLPAHRCARCRPCADAPGCPRDRPPPRPPPPQGARRRSSSTSRGVGYRVHDPALAPSTASASRAPRSTLLIHTHVREDALALFGFLTADEQALFERLIAVSGIGPKLALGILSGIEAPELVAALRASDVARLTRIPGVGKKTAERLVLELKDKLPGPRRGRRPRPPAPARRRGRPPLRPRQPRLLAPRGRARRRPGAARARRGPLRGPPRGGPCALLSGR